MKSSWLERYRKQWPRLGAVGGMVVAGGATLSSRKLSRLQMLSAANFVALLVHQYEEYVDPGWFPGQFNHGLFKSETPRNFPLNTNTALCVNTAFGYPFYLAPIVFPRQKWLGIGPVLFGISQAFSHGILIPRVAGDRYSPGFLASIFLHVPVGFTYLRALREDSPITRGDWAKGAAWGLFIVGAGVVAPNLIGRDPHSLHAFEERQMGHHDTAVLPA